MKKNHSLLALLVINISLSLLLSCAKKGQDVAEETAAVNKTTQAYLDAVNSGDLTSWANTLADDIVYQPPDQPQLNGKDAVVKWAKESFFDPLKMKLELQREKVEISGDLAFCRGRFTLATTPSQGGSTNEVSGKFVDIFRPEPTGDWKYVHVCFSSDAPLPPSQ